MVIRIEGWEKRYSHYLHERRSMPFEWGSNDCMHFVGGGVEAITSLNLYAPYTGYKDEDGAGEVLKKHGGIVSILNTCLGHSHVNFKAAKRGDVVIVRSPEIIAGLVGDCGQKIVAVTEDGWVKLPLNYAQRIWSY